ncbi:MAG TPA: metallophosphoesterase [Polymorphobacter sp.]|nr:metallophosphoesterase [Polymorphobacter sp.]
MRRILLFPLLILVALGLFGYAGARQQPRVVRYDVALPDWPAGQPPLRIVQLSDLHGSWLDMPPDRISGIVAQVNALHPDVIVLTGDYIGGKWFDWPHIRLEDFTDRLGKLRARYGVYAVVGNHDTRYWTRWAFDRVGIRTLINQRADIGPVTLAGVDDITNMTNTAPPLRATIAGASTAKPLLLLAHEPDFFLNRERAIDLIISGHTHGGQIKLPLIGARRLGPFLDAHLRGNFFEDGRRLIVSSGLGTSIVPIRIGVRPEIVVITISGAPSRR